MTAPTATPNISSRLITPPSTMSEPLPQAMLFMVFQACLRYSRGVVLAGEERLAGKIATRPNSPTCRRSRRAASYRSKPRDRGIWRRCADVLGDLVGKEHRLQLADKQVHDEYRQHAEHHRGIDGIGHTLGSAFGLQPPQAGHQHHNRREGQRLEQREPDIDRGGEGTEGWPKTPRSTWLALTAIARPAKTPAAIMMMQSMGAIRIIARKRGMTSCSTGSMPSIPWRRSPPG